jgi:hypothetical protein
MNDTIAMGEGISGLLLARACESVVGSVRDDELINPKVMGL